MGFTETETAGIGLAKYDDIGPIAEALETVLERLSNRDVRGFE